jgi:hypothetical protein
MRQVKIGLLQDDLAKIETGTTMVFETIDSTGKKWKGTLARVQSGYALIFDEMANWTIYVEGVLIGNAMNADPGEAVREAFLSAGLTSMPEGVEVKAVSADGETWVIFALNGAAHKATAQEFNETVAKGTHWVQARTAKRQEIDALRQELSRMKKP